MGANWTRLQIRIFNYFLQERNILTAYEKMQSLGAWTKSCITRQFRIPRLVKIFCPHCSLANNDTFTKTGAYSKKVNILCRNIINYVETAEWLFAVLCWPQCLILIYALQTFPWTMFLQFIGRLNNTNIPSTTCVVL